MKYDLQPAVAGMKYICSTSHDPGTGPDCHIVDHRHIRTRGNLAGLAKRSDMDSNFLFVPVDPSGRQLNNKYSRDHVAPEYRSMIRSHSARSPWSRALPGQNIIYGLPSEVPTPGQKFVKTEDTVDVPTAWLPVSTPPPVIKRRPRIKQEEFETENSIITNNSQDSRSQTPSSSDYKVPDHALSTRYDPFWMFPVPYRESMAKMIEFSECHQKHSLSFSTPYNLQHDMLMMLLRTGLSAINIHIPLLDDPRTRKTPSSWALTEMFARNRESPTFMFATLLQAGGCLLPSNSARRPQPHTASSASDSAPAPSQQEEMHWLHYSAVQAINTDLGDPDLLSPNNYDKFASLLAAISTLATYEYHFGDRRLQRLHHKGMAQMINLKGGIGTLDPLQRRFYDYVIKITVLSKQEGGARGTADEVRFNEGIVASASALRSVLYEPARALGIERLDEMLGPEDE